MTLNTRVVSDPRHHNLLIICRMPPGENLLHFPQRLESLSCDDKNIYCVHDTAVDGSVEIKWILIIIDTGFYVLSVNRVLMLHKQTLIKILVRKIKIMSGRTSTKTLVIQRKVSIIKNLFLWMWNSNWTTLLVQCSRSDSLQ